MRWQIWILSSAASADKVYYPPHWCLVLGSPCCNRPASSHVTLGSVAFKIFSYAAFLFVQEIRAWRDFSISKILVRIRLISSQSPISKHETWKKISRSRLEPWDIDKKSRSRLKIRDLENKILVLVSNREIERDNILKSERTAFHLLVLFVRHW